ncbi:MAG: pyridoxamine 5'-phosphate oxidase family protein [Gammaproteobacteria bacterium]|nr:pyridoxamine 5'-phosphate oxidase family protein [Gammaproteobacteria bacterium]
MFNYKETVEKYMQDHRYLTLATCDQKLKPWAATMGFASDGATVYMATSKKTKKVEHIKNNPNVSYTIDAEEEKDWDELTGLQMEARAEILNDENEIGKAKQLLAEKFPEFADIPAGDDMVIIKIIPKRGRFLDCTQGFGFSADLDY